MSAQDFFDKYNGIGLDYDGSYGNQCMDLALYYNQEVVGAPRLIGNAADVWDTYPQDYYDRIVNTPDGVPNLGDVMIWGRGVGPDGHIAVFQEGDPNQFTSQDINWPVQGYYDKDGNFIGTGVCHFQPHSYNGVIGWLRPKSGIIFPEPDNMSDEQKRVLQFIDQNKGTETNLESVVRSWHGAASDLPLVSEQRDNYQADNNIHVNQIADLQQELKNCQQTPVDPSNPPNYSIGDLLTMLVRKIFPK